ncbi:MAG: MoxR family ATPase [Spirochaetes bacterium]|nr:MoxR family ATPase [Spirochaetota bacterium]
MDIIEKIAENIEKVILGKRLEIFQILKGVISGGHILLEDVPGVGKTMFVKVLAKSFNMDFSRIQFTPDLLPSDITGVSIFNQKKAEFEFRKGPVFSNIILADEINRTSPKTQSALLEAMEEYQISEGNATYHLEKPFIVVATQNPIEFEGTYKLPEAQLDRFMMRIRIGYAATADETRILQQHSKEIPFEMIKPVASSADLIKIQNEVRKIIVSEKISAYIADICRRTRENKYISLGLSTRGALALQRISQATAYLNKRKYVIPEDVKENIFFITEHRIILSEIAEASEVTKDTVIKNIINSVPVPAPQNEYKI